MINQCPGPNQHFCHFHKLYIVKLHEKKIVPSSWINSVTLYLQDKKYSPTIMHYCQEATYKDNVNYWPKSKQQKQGFPIRECSPSIWEFFFQHQQIIIDDQVYIKIPGKKNNCSLIREQYRFQTQNKEDIIHPNDNKKKGNT